MKFRSKFLLAKIESTEDTDASPVGTDAVLTSNLSVDVYQGNTISRDYDRGTLGASESINVNPHNSYSFEVEGQASGTAGTAPAYGELLRACGLGETIVASTSVTYAPVSSGYESATLYHLRLQDDGNNRLIKSTGVRGNVGLTLNAGDFPKWNFSNLLGTYYTPSEISAVTADTSDYVAPIASTKDNTPTVTVGGTAACLSAFSVDLGNAVDRRDAPGCRSTIITDRNVTGSITIKAPDTGTKNYFSDVESHNGVSTVAIVVTHGTTAGEIITVNLPTAQLSNISETEVNGELFYTMNFIAVPTATGDDEISIVMT